MNLNYKLEFSNESKKYLKKLDKPTARRILEAVESIKESPRQSSSIKKMQGYDAEVYRLRVGTYRVIYEIVDDKLIIFIVRIGPRGDIYK